LDLVAAAVRSLPSGLRTYGRDWFETRFRGTPRGMLNFRSAELKLDLDFVLSHYRIEHPDIRYLQIGAFDGVQGDPLYPLIKRHGLHGILLEPQKDAFARLRANYAEFNGFRFINAAIAAHDGESTLYRIKAEAKGPSWLHQIASFDREVILRHAHMVSDLESMIETEKVRCMSFATLFDEIGLQKVDMLQVDTEGFDAEILRLFDVAKRTPAIVRFEHKHLSANDHAETLAMLVREGYRFTICGNDTLAYRYPVSSQQFRTA
jgi:FkbM family methyltransferase